ncbi:MAG: outer membrane lipoprotein carrier protein LolA [Pseudomonadota bacterium]
MNLLFTSAMAVFCMDVAVSAPLAETRALAGGDAHEAAAPAEPVRLAQAPIADPASESIEEGDAQTVAPSSETPAPQAETDAAAIDIVEAERPPLVFEGESDEAIAEKLVAYLDDLTTLKGTFRQVAPSGAISTGEFFLRRPGMLRFEYDAPNPLLIVANGGLVYVRDEALETTDSYPVGKTPLKFLLQKKVDLDDAKIIAVDRGIDTVAVTFASDDDETEGELTIIAKAPEFTLSRWVVRDLQNGITEVSLSDVIAGERLANRLFRAPEAGGQFLKN